MRDKVGVAGGGDTEEELKFMRDAYRDKVEEKPGDETEYKLDDLGSDDEVSKLVKNDPRYF